MVSNEKLFCLQNNGAELGRGGPDNEPCHAKPDLNDIGSKVSQKIRALERGSQ